MTDFRALCAELADSLEEWLSSNSIGGISLDDGTDAELIFRVRAALSQPEPQGPTDEEPTDQEIEEWADAAAEVPLEEMDPEVHGWRRCFKSDEFSETIRAALARWGRPAIEPVPTSERPILKSDPFNNADGHCWCGLSDFIDETGDHPVSFPASWELREPCPQDDCVLPHWALPVPGMEGADA